MRQLVEQCSIKLCGVFESPRAGHADQIGRGAIPRAGVAVLNLGRLPVALDDPLRLLDRREAVLGHFGGGNLFRWQAFALSDIEDRVIPQNWRGGAVFVLLLSLRTFLLAPFPEDDREALFALPDVSAPFL